MVSLLAGSCSTFPILDLALAVPSACVAIALSYSISPHTLVACGVSQFSALGSLAEHAVKMVCDPGVFVVIWEMEKTVKFKYPIWEEEWAHKISSLVERLVGTRGQAVPSP